MEITTDSEDGYKNQNCANRFWTRKNTLQKILVISAIVIPVIMLIITTVILLSRGQNGIQSEEPECLDSHCLLADSIVNRMNLSVDPCVDFYSYACNGWIKSNPAPDDRKNWNVLLKLKEENQLVVKRILEQPNLKLDSIAEQKARLYYESCMDSQTIENLQVKPIKAKIKILGEWSNSNKFEIKKWSLQNIMQLVQNRYSVDALFFYEVSIDDRNASKYILNIGPSYLTLQQPKHYRDQKKLDIYDDFMTHVGVLTGAANEQMKKVRDFEIKIANITRPDYSSNYLTIKELNKTVTFIDWFAFFKHAKRIFDWSFNMNEEIMVYSVRYLKTISQLVEEYQRTDEGKRILNDYLIWKTVYAFSPLLCDSVKEAYETFRSSMWSFQTVNENQWKKCIQETNKAFGFATESIFVRETFHSDSKQKAEEIASNIHKIFKYNIQNLQWMDEDAKKAAVAKLDRVSFAIGYPELIQNITLLDDYYDTIVIRNDTYFDNNLGIRFFQVKKKLHMLNESVYKTSWNQDLSTVTGRYNTRNNQIQFPAGILQKPFYGSELPNSLNYGALGVLIGQELTHGFDKHGHKYDQNGNWNPWWNSQTENNFASRTKCFVEKYGKGSLNILSESIADNGGLKNAFGAYLDLMENQSEPKMLPKLSLNHRQLFFLAFAQIWCTSVKDGGTLEFPFAQYRVNEALRNFNDFGKEFGCGVDTEMNPEKKCEVW